MSRFGRGIPSEQRGRAARVEPRERPAPAAPKAPAAAAYHAWSIPLVFDRIVEAVETLGRIPMTVRPRGYANSMPAAVHDRLPLIDIVELEQSGELSKLHERQNTVRLPARARDITRMDQAINWPLQYLRDMPEVSQAVLLAALWKVLGADVAKRCRRRGIPTRAFHRRKIHGLDIIARELNRARTPVS